MLRFFACLSCLLAASSALAQLPRFENYGYNLYSNSSDQPKFVKSADFNGDGVADVIFNPSSSDQLVMVSYISTNAFTDPVVVIEDFPDATFMEIGDLEGDGDIDIVIRLSNSENYYAYANNGDGTFASSSYIGDGSGAPRDMILADIDNDGDLDLVGSHWSSWEGPSIQWYRNNGGTWSNFNLSTEWNWEDLALGDLDGDGDLDLLVSQYNDEIHMWEFTGSNFSYTGVIISKDASIRSLHIFDVDGDGDQDVFAGWYGSSEDLYWYENTGDETFWPEHFIAHPYGALYDSWPADLDNDGDLDLIISAYWYEYNIGYLVNKGGEFSGYFGINFLTDAGDVEELETADVDDDGYLDVLYLEEYGATIRYYENRSGLGCLDEDACNYDPYAWREDVCYETCGCWDWNADNEDELSNENNGGCLYLTEGYVFQDTDGSGFQSGSEPFLAGQPVKLYPSGQTVYTNSEGYFSALVPAGVTELYADVTAPFNQTTNNAWGYYSEHQNEPYVEYFGVTATEESTAVGVSIYPTGTTALCNAPHQYIVVVENQGTTAFSGDVSLTYDELFQGYEEMTPVDAVSENTLTWNLASLPPGSSQVFNVRLITPTVAFIGDPFAHEASATATVDDVEVASTSTTFEDVVTCAYDPNDKLAFPLGHGEDHRLPAGETQTFVVRFQNTGNAPATDIVVRDTLDVNWDLASLELLSLSHSAQVVVDPNTREMAFYFDNILLPDSNCCEPDSHGMLSYSLRSNPDLAPETRLENTAYIYFDNNPAIVTNTTWTTIHACQEEVTVSLGGNGGCLSTSLDASSNFIPTDGWNETTTWLLNGEELGTETTLSWFPEETASGTLIFQAENPLCEHTVETTVYVNPSSSSGTCSTDLNCDGVTGASDVVLFLGHWKCEGTSCIGDFTGDALVSSEDLIVMLGVLGTECD